MFRKQEEPTNNALHTAILNRDNTAALELIASISKQELNHPSLGNTPLMLALKTANFEVARAILKRDDAVVVSDSLRDNAADSRGITPLHLACAWRENDIIQTILAKTQKFIAKEYGDHFDIKEIFTIDPSDAALVYQVRLYFMIDRFKGLHQVFKKQIEARSMGKIYREDYDRKSIHRDIESHEYYLSIVDGHGLIIIPAPELTDSLLFHSKSICLNLGLLEEKDFKNYPSSQHQFAHNLSVGLAAILEHRNQKPLDEKIIEIFAANNPAAALSTNPK